MKYLTIILILLCAASASGADTTITYFGVLDAHTVSTNADVNYGQAETATIDKDTRYAYFWPDGCDTASVLSGASVISCKLKVYYDETLITDTGTIAYYRNLVDYLEGEGEGAASGGNDHTAFGGPTANHYKRPSHTWTSDALPSALDLRDSLELPPVWYQSSCGGCWAQAWADAMGFYWSLRVFDGTPGFNTSDSADADRGGIGEFQGENDYVKEISATGDYFFNIGKSITNKDTMYLVLQPASAGGDIMIDLSTVRVGVSYESVSDTVFYSDGDIDVACLNSASPTTVWTDTDSLILDADHQTILLCIYGLRGYLSGADSETIIESARLKFTVDGYYGSAFDAVVYEGEKLFTESEASWRYAASGRRWREWGCGYGSSRHFSARQIVECATGDCTGGYVSDAADWTLDNYCIPELTRPYPVPGSSECWNDSVSGTVDSVWQPGYYWNFSDIDSLKRAIAEWGPCAVFALYTNGSQLGDIAPSECFLTTGQIGSHAVVVVGWDDTYSCDTATGAWIVRNSWGDGWADDGYGYVAYSALNWAGGEMVGLFPVTEKAHKWTVGQYQLLGTVEFTASDDTYLEFDIPASWAQEWIDGTATSNAIQLRTSNENNHPRINMNESATNKSYFEFTVYYPTTAVGGGVNVGAGVKF